MKHVYKILTASILILFLSLNFSDPDSKYYTVNGTIKQCERNYIDLGDRDLKLIQNNQVIIDSIENDCGEFAIKNLTAGLYTIEYRNIFSQIIREDFNVIDNNTILNLCNDNLQETNEVTFIEQLNENDTITLYFSSQSCGGGSPEEELSIYLVENKVIMEYTPFRRLKYRWGKIKYKTKGLTKKTLKKDDINYFRTFEKKLRLMENALTGCSTYEYYTLVLNKKDSIKIEDESCDWQGFLLLGRQLF
jgi:hypothetical protein